MKLTKEEEKICKQYSKLDKNGHIQCKDCPLAIDKEFKLCKATVTKKQWKEYKCK